MPNAAAQLVVDPLFRRGVLFFGGGIRDDVFGDLFNSKDFFRKQVKTEKTERGNHEIASKIKKRVNKELTFE
jgi:stalled ribosome alternative rescue factor ArfA